MTITSHALLIPLLLPRNGPQHLMTRRRRLLPVVMIVLVEVTLLAAAASAFGVFRPG